MKGLIIKINDNWMVVSDKRTFQDPSAEELILPLHIDDLWVIRHIDYVLGKNQKVDFEIKTVEEGVTDCGTHIIYKDYAKLITQPTKKSIMTADEILQKHEDANEMHFHEVDRKWIIEAMEEYAKEKSEIPIIPEIIPMEKKQTAVERLVRKVSNELIGEIPMHRWDEIRDVVQQAKEIEKKQLIECFLEAEADAYRKEPKYKTPQDYIRQTYEH